MVGFVLLAVVALSGAPAAARAPGSAAPEVGSSDWRQVSAGGAHTCGIRASGRLYCWGSDNFGQLGNGVTTGLQSTPDEVAGGGTDWASVSAGARHTCARKTTGRLYCWGDDNNDQLGNGAPTGNRVAPEEVAGSATNWASVSSGAGHTCARKTTGRLYCWGGDLNGQLGNGTAIGNRSIPVQVAGGATNWASVSAGARHTCALKTTRRLYCWGADNNGRLGNGNISGDQPVPGEVAGGATDWAMVSVGGHTCALTTSHRLYCWGGDLNGQLGNGAPTIDQRAPFEVAGGATNWRTVDVGALTTCAGKTTGRLYCWGADDNGQLGNGGPVPGTDQTIPAQVAGGATDWATVDVGDAHTCARITTRRLYCWGDNLSGALGNGTDDPTLADRSRPVEVFVP